MYLSEAIDKFLEYSEIERNLSLKTIENYQHYLNRLYEFAGDIPVADLDEKTIRKWRMWLNRIETQTGDNIAKSTQKYHLIALRNFLRYLSSIDVKVISSDKIDLGKTKRPSIEFLSSDEIEKILSMPDQSTISGARDYAILCVLYSSGLRVSELVGLNKDSLDIDSKKFSVRGKGSKDRLVFINDRAVNAVTRYYDQRTDNLEPAFLQHSNYASVTRDGDFRRLTPRSIQRMIKKYSSLAGIKKHVTTHTLRHSYATTLLENGADIRSVQTLLGHSDISTTQIYTHVTDRGLEKAYENYQPR
ncbi:TPA: site-specific tyrosine recombinase XerD [Candidatus Saccharibacteria bacterium]|nr:site-specific tyrosine recombinase XerD [Candidatus Saccharibacteria bacterium]HIO87702.1 site-specific tyrosine recombinase XerD [Candidatus Saccharibacteria bacterium]